MYREAAAAGVIKGARTGPYAGGPRQVDVAKLSAAARQRLTDVLAGRAEPTPILHERRPTPPPRIRTTWAILFAMFGLFNLTAVGFANRTSAWAVQPSATALGYGALLALIAVAVLEVVRRRARVTGTSSLTPGRYLLPFDVLVVHAPGRDGTQLLEVTPLGDARGARIEDEGAPHLVLVFARGDEIRFSLRSVMDGENALRRLAYAQALLEELTFEPDLARALANDPISSIRADDAWDAVAPAATANARARARPALLQSPLSTALVVACGFALGGAWLAGRNWVSARSVHAQTAAMEAAKSRRALLGADPRARLP